MTTMQLPADFKFKGKPLLLIAIGATLAFLPSIIGLITLIAHAYYEADEFMIPFIVQAVGAGIMLAGYSMAYIQVKQLNVKRAGLMLGIIASSMGFVSNLLFGIINSCDFMALHIGKIYFGTLLLVIGFLSISPLLAVSSFKLSKYFTKFRVFGISMSIVSGVILASYLIWFAFPHGAEKRQSVLENVNRKGFCKIERYNEYTDSYEFTDYICYKRFSKRSWYSDTKITVYEIVDEPLSIITWLALGMSLMGAMTAAWMLTRAKLLKTVETKNESKVPMPEVVAAPIDDHSRYMPNEDHSRYMPIEDHSRYMPKEESADTKSGLSDDIVNLLMGYDNARLKEIIENPYRYNPVVVEKAGLLLRRRLAWEQIKDLSDKELLAMTMAPKGLYDADIVEAAAMELYQRDSQLLREQFMMMVPDTVSDLASGRTPAPEGIRLAAQRYLSKFTRP